MNTWSRTFTAVVPAALVSTAWWPLPVNAQVPGRCEIPVSQRTSDVGCWVAATKPVGPFGRASVYWHLYTFTGRSAAEAASPPDGVIVQAFGKTWLLVVADRAWHPSGGDRVDVVGPLEVDAARPYIARYLEATIPPGERTAVHTHAGPEAWHVISGAQCLEAPGGISVVKAGESAVVQQGPPMMLSSVGTETRRTLVLVLHDAVHPWTEPAASWTPAGACPK